jgi:hypothetical protein
MNKLVFIFILLNGSLMWGQKVTFTEEGILLELLFIEENTLDTLPGSIIEIFSGGTRINTGVSDFKGNDTFYLAKKDIVNNTIKLQVYGLKCKPKKYKLSTNKSLNPIIKLKYGKTIYNTREDGFNLRKKLDFRVPESLGCGTLD